MSIYVGKIVAYFALPLGWVLLAGMVALGLLAAHRQRAAGVVIALQWVVLWVGAMPWLDQRLTGWLEAEYPPAALEAILVAEVAVAMGADKVTPGADQPLRRLQADDRAHAGGL